MTAPPDDRAQLIEAITRQVMAGLAGTAGTAGPGSGPDGLNCATCVGGCATVGWVAGICSNSGFSAGGAASA